MDLSALSDADFDALHSGNLKGMSEDGFAQLLRAQSAAMTLEEKTKRFVDAERERLNPVNDMSTPQLVGAAFGKSIADTGQALQQAIPGGGVSRSDVDETRKRDAPLMRTTAGKVGYTLGAGAQAVPLMMAPGANTVGGAALAGGLLGALTPVGTEDSQYAPLWNALTGSLVGGTTTAGVNMLSRFIQPQLKPGTQELIDSGITLTPGQRLGGGAKRAEDAMTSIPVSGDFIKSAQRRSVQDFNAAIANKALKPIGDKLPAGTVGRDAVAYVETKLGDAYESALRQVGNVASDAAFQTELTSLRQAVKSSTMPKEVKAQFENAIRAQIDGKFMGGKTGPGIVVQGQGPQRVMTAQTFKDAEGEIGRLATKYASDPSVDKQLLGDALQEAQAALRRLLERSAGPDVAGDVKAANAGWTEFKRMQRASTFLGAKDGVFSPENYMNAVKALDRSKDNSAFARGTAPGQEFGANALRVMGATVPDSGTPFRTLMANPLQGIVSAVVPGAAVIPAYSKPSQALLQTLMSGKRPALATKLAAELEAARPALAAMGITGENAFQRLQNQ